MRKNIRFDTAAPRNRCCFDIVVVVVVVICFHSAMTNINIIFDKHLLTSNDCDSQGLLQQSHIQFSFYYELRNHHNKFKLVIIYLMLIYKIFTEIYN
jgi:hypothetical protein